MLSATVVASESDKNVASIAFLKCVMIEICYCCLVSFLGWILFMRKVISKSLVGRDMCRLKNRAKES